MGLDDEDPQGELERLRGRIAELEREVARLSVNARRFEALLGSEAVSVSVFDPATCPTVVNRGWEVMWRLPPEAVLGSGYSMLADPQVREKGVIPYLERVLRGESVVLPMTDYDPEANELVKAGRRVCWYGTIAVPIKDEAGAVEEFLFIQYDVSDLQYIRQRNEELLVEQRGLEASLRERNRELEETVAVTAAQRDAIQRLGAPVIQVWTGILVLPLIGIVDDARAAQILEGLLTAVTQRGAREVIIDITGVPTIDARAIESLLRAVAAARLVGAICTLSGVSPGIARTIVELGADVGALATCATLEEGLRQALGRQRRGV